jgi:hypothetical protein
MPHGHTLEHTIGTLISHDAGEKQPIPAIHYAITSMLNGSLRY